MLSGIPEGACACGAEGRMASIGPSALGAKGCVERLRRFAQGATAVEGAFKFIEGASLYKTIQPPCGRRKCIPLWWLAPPPFPRSSVGRQKESALMGRLGALLRPTWRSYAGPPQWHYKAPLCCERLMKGMLRGVLFCPLNRGGKGTRFVREQSDLRIV